MSKVLFVNPFFLKNSVLEQEWMMPYFPLGLLYLAASAKQAGHQVAVFDGTFATSEAAFGEMLAQYQPDVVCIASLITLRPVALQLARTAHEFGAVVIFGGPDPTLEPSVYLEQAAVVVMGEGERTLLELLPRFDSDFADVAGIAYYKDGTVIQTPTPEPIWNLDELPLPARHLIDAKPYLAAWADTHGYTSMTLAASRGCPYGCEYCQQSAVGPHFRRRTPSRVAQEMKHIEENYAPDRFRLVDDLDGLGETWLLELADAMQQLGIHTPYEGLRPTTLTNLPLYNPMKMLCGKRNRYLPTTSDHPHALPALDAETMRLRWGEGVLPDGN